MLNNTQVASWRCTPPPCPKRAAGGREHSCGRVPGGLPRAGGAEAERAATTSQPTPMSPHHKPLELTAPPHAACRPHAPRVPVSRKRVRARCLSPGEAAECPSPSREAYALGSGAGWFRHHHLPQVESVELVSRFWRRARPAVFQGLPFSAVLWLPEGVHSRPSRDPGGAPPGGGQARPLRLRRKI